MKVNNLLIAFFADSPPCSAQTCPEMRASEWQYLCAVHDPPKSCCAIDYCCHTLDWATNILTSPKYFPSRLTLGSETGGGAQASMRHLTNIFRRLYRIFAHAWFQHREVFWQVEGHDGLYVFFKTVCDMYSLIPEDNYTVPAEAEGADVQQQPPALEHTDKRRMTILRKDNESFAASLENMESASISTGATTRRHKNSPSVSSSVTTISEGAEDDEHPRQQAVAAATAAVAAANAAAAASSSTAAAASAPAPASAPEPEAEPTPEAASEEQASEPEPSADSNGSKITVSEVHAEDDEAAPESTEKPEPAESETKVEADEPAAEAEAEAEGEASVEAAEAAKPDEKSDAKQPSEQEPPAENEAAQEA